MTNRFLVTCWPFPAHLFPQMSIAIALRDRGHEVAFYSAEDVRPLVEAEGFDFFPFVHVDKRQYEKVQSAEEKTGGRRQSVRVQHQALRRWLLGTVPAQVQDIRAVIEAWAPDVIVTDIGMWGPTFVLSDSERIPVALASNFMGSLLPGPDAPPFGFGLAPPTSAGRRLADAAVARVTEMLGTPMRRQMNRIRADNNLSPLKTSLSKFPGQLPLYLVGSLPELDYGRVPTKNVRYVGSYIWHPPAPLDDRDWLNEIPDGQPWVHVTEGTSHFQDPFVLKAAVAGLADAPVEIVAATGRDRDPEKLDVGPIAHNIHIAEWLNYSDLLPRCQLVVTTGGATTIMAALQHGLPLIVVPTTWDKPDNARRVVEAGVGVKLPPRKCTPDGLRAAIFHVLKNPSYATRAREISERLTELSGPERAAELLETLTTNHSSREMS